MELWCYFRKIPYLVLVTSNDPSQYVHSYNNFTFLNLAYPGETQNEPTIDLSIAQTRFSLSTC